jgi:hypothetical protein
MSSHIPTDAYVMIIGAMKAGTSSLFRLLREHPSICAAQAKEPEFFSQHQGHALNVSHYEDLFPSRSEGHSFYLEASTGYTKYPEERDVPLRIKKQGLNPRFIYLVRDPLSRTLSHLNYAVLNNHAWASDPLFGFYAVTFSMYYTQLSQYIAHHFPDTDRYFIADFDDLKARPAELTDEIYRWLELEPRADRNVSPANVTPPRSKAELALVRSPLHRFRNIIPSGIRDSVKTLLRSYSEPAEYDLSDVDRERLREWLHDDMMAFKNTFGFPVEKWGFED